MAYTAVLRRVGGSVILAVPPALLELAGIAAGQRVVVSAQNGRIVIEGHRRPRYGLAELIAQCDPSLPVSEEDQEWLGAAPVGRELL